jgi:hypothetical protein
MAQDAQPSGREAATTRASACQTVEPVRDDVHTNCGLFIFYPCIFLDFAHKPNRQDHT